MAAKPKNHPSVSVIIPTLNEADYVGYLLYSLSRQTYKNFEVIVSDGSSQDETKQVVESFIGSVPNLKFVSSKKRSPAIQRNAGAKLAKFEQLLFLDADTILPTDFLEKNLAEIKKRKLDLAHPIFFPVTKRILDQYIYLIMNLGLDLMQHISPVAGGCAVFTTSELFQKLGGFNENLRIVGEDTDFVTRAVKLGCHFGILKSSGPYVSARRFDYEGRGGAVKNLLVHGIIFALFGKTKGQEFIERPYGDYTRLAKLVEKEKSKSSFLRKLNSREFKKFTANLKSLFKEI